MKFAFFHPCTLARRHRPRANSRRDYRADSVCRGIGFCQRMACRASLYPLQHGFLVPDFWQPILPPALKKSGWGRRSWCRRCTTRCGWPRIPQCWTWSATDAWTWALAAAPAATSTPATGWTRRRARNDSRTLSRLSRDFGLLRVSATKAGSTSWMTLTWSRPPYSSPIRPFTSPLPALRRPWSFLVSSGHNLCVAVVQDTAAALELCHRFVQLSEEAGNNRPMSRNPLLPLLLCCRDRGAGSAGHRRPD